ncbi:MAG: T9SS type A sorting domain-containing protein, partial [Chitinophagaceae bacterium]
YKIKPLASVVVDDLVESTADIYFDFNPAITTNTASTVFVEELGTADNQAPQFLVFPNPARHSITVQGETPISNLTITDLNGRVLTAATAETGALRATVDVSHLATGLYVLSVKSGTSVSTYKFVKK